MSYQAPGLAKAKQQRREKRAACRIRAAAKPLTAHRSLLTRRNSA